MSDSQADDRVRDLTIAFEKRLAGILNAIEVADGAIAAGEGGETSGDEYADVRSVIRLAEPDTLDPCSLDVLAENADRLAYLVGLAAGRGVRTLAIAPVPGYMEPLIPLFEQHFEKVVLCDNYKVGKVVGGCAPMVDLDTLLDAMETIDCVLIGTVDQRIRDLFAARLPASKTITLYDVLENVIQSAPAMMRHAEDIAARIKALDNPFVVLCHRFTPPYISFLKGLDDAGFNVVILSRFKGNAGIGTQLTDLRELGAAAVFGVSLIESLRIGELVRGCPWWLLNDGFIHAGWSFKRAAWHYAYTAALLQMIEAPRILCLYDPIKPARTDYEYEALALAAYGEAIRSADGLHIGCASDYLVDFVTRATQATCPAIGFLRYNLTPEGDRPQRYETLSLALVSPIAAEVPDPGTDLRAPVRDLLRAGIDLHYYMGSPESEIFKQNLPPEEAQHLFIHKTIIDQEELVREISRCHAGWCVANLNVFDDIVVSVQSPMARDLYSLFPRTTVPSRALAFGAAGLPVVYNSVLHEVAHIFPKGCAIPFDFSQSAASAEILRQQDWPQLWRTMDAAAESFRLSTHFPRFLSFLDEAKRFAAARIARRPAADRPQD